MGGLRKHSLVSLFCLLGVLGILTCSKFLQVPLTCLYISIKVPNISDGVLVQWLTLSSYSVRSSHASCEVTGSSTVNDEYFLR